MIYMYSTVHTVSESTLAPVPHAASEWCAVVQRRRLTRLSFAEQRFCIIVPDFQGSTAALRVSLPPRE